MAVYAPLTFLGASAFAVGCLWPAAGALLGLVAGLTLVLENRPIQVLSQLVTCKRSRNVVARRDPEGESTQDIVVLAHIDSPLVSDIRNVRLVHALFLGMVGSCLGVGVTSVVVALGGPQWALLIGLPCAVHLAVCTAIMVHQALASPVTVGAGDNASGVAALLQAARELPPLGRSTVWFVGDGGEEPGLLGAVRFFATRGLDPARTWVLNVDMVSAGSLRVSREEGMVFRHRCDPVLCRLAAEEGAAMGLTVGAEVLRAMSTDACAALSRGHRAVSLGSTVGYWHQLADTPERVDATVVAQASELLRRMIERLDAST
jgi:hypothetical protein